jgi:hypothetical protein
VFSWEFSWKFRKVQITLRLCNEIVIPNLIVIVSLLQVWVVANVGSSEYEGRSWQIIVVRRLLHV